MSSTFIDYPRHSLISICEPLCFHWHDELHRRAYGDYLATQTGHAHWEAAVIRPDGPQVYMHDDEIRPQRSSHRLGQLPKANTGSMSYRNASGSEIKAKRRSRCALLQTYSTRSALSHGGKYIQNLPVVRLGVGTHHHSQRRRASSSCRPMCRPPPQRPVLATPGGHPATHVYLLPRPWTS